MKIVIIGAGIGGLATYHALKKHLLDEPNNSDIEVAIYESHRSLATTTSVIGAGLGLAPNGIRAIASVSPNAASYIQDRGYAGAQMTFRNAKGSRLGQISGGSKKRYGFDQLMLPRAVVHEALLQEVPPGVIKWGTGLKTMKETEKGVEIEFSNGSVQVVHLVIGADGVRSIVREIIFKGQFPAEYDGLTGVGGFIPFASLPSSLKAGLKEEGVTMTFGPHGFFGYSMCTPYSDNDGDNLAQWWSTYECPDPPPSTTPPSVVEAQLIERHGSWKSPYDTPNFPVYRSIINIAYRSNSDSVADKKSLLILPRYVVTRLVNWCSFSGRVILLGDAAHAMPPDSGQGASCAVEDAVAIALLLKHYGSSNGDGDYSPTTLKQVAHAYEEIRIPRVRKILDFAKRNGDAKKKLTPWQERVRDGALWLFCKILPESFNDGLYGYDVDKVVQKYVSKL